MNIILRPSPIDEFANDKSECFDWGYKEYRKVNGEWKLDHVLIVNEEARRTDKVFSDSRPMETMAWGSRIA